MTTEVKERIDIHEPIAEICKRLGLEPTNVAAIRFRPTHVVADVYELNEQGGKFIEANGKPAMQSYVFDVTT